MFVTSAITGACCGFIATSTSTTPRSTWVNLIQYDNVSNTAGINMRLHWIPEAGREVFFVINHTLEEDTPDGSFRSTFSDATVKFSYTLRF